MLDGYFIVIWVSSLVILSYLYNLISKSLKIPSVLLLIGTGIALNFAFQYFNFKIPDTFKTLEVLGIIGLIMIVLEASLDLHLSKDKWPVIRNSMGLAVIILLISTLTIGLIIKFTLQINYLPAIVYAIPLSVVSSAIVIPSVGHLSAEKKEFLIYESTFSDIFGIMFFFMMTTEGDSGFHITFNIIMSLVLTIVFSFVFSFLLVYLFNKITTEIKLFLMMAILMLLYGVGKKAHLSPLLLVLVFGLVLNNYKIFIKGKLARIINPKNMDSIFHNFKIITAESAFLVRTFFFVTFGLSFSLIVLLSWQVLIVGSLIVIALYAVRYLNLKLLLKTNLFPEIFYAPRGLITILLFYQIPEKFQIAEFSEGILFFVILVTSLIMMVGMILSKQDLSQLKDMDLGSSPTTDQVKHITDLGVTKEELLKLNNGDENE